MIPQINENRKDDEQKLEVKPSISDRRKLVYALNLQGSQTKRYLEYFVLFCLRSFSTEDILTPTCSARSSQLGSEEKNSKRQNDQNLECKH